MRCLNNFHSDSLKNIIFKSTRSLSFPSPQTNEALGYFISELGGWFLWCSFPHTMYICLLDGHVQMCQNTPDWLERFPNQKTP